MKVHPIKRENAFDKLNQISFFLLEQQQKTQTFVFVLSLARKKIEQLNCCCSHLFANWADYMPQNWSTSKNFEKKFENVFKNCHSEVVKNQRYSALFQRKSPLKQRCSALILISENFRFQCCSEVSQCCSEFLARSDNEWRWNRPEIILNQRADQCWISLRFQPGLLSSFHSFSAMICRDFHRVPLMYRYYNGKWFVFQISENMWS